MTDHDRTHDTPEARADQAMPPPPELEHDDYRNDLAEFGLTTEQENQILETLWNIVRDLVDMGFGLDSAQMVIPAFMQSALDSDDTLEEPEGAADE